MGEIASHTALAAAVLALFRDPYFDPGCLANCNVNVFVVHSLPSLARAAEIAEQGSRLDQPLHP
jgi:hypothetical protein